MTEKVTIGIIGAGRIGRLHAENLAFRVPGAQVLAVSDIVPEVAQRCAAACGIPRALEDYRRILDDPAVEAVAICSSTDSHAQIIEEAAAAGKHIFCEKPIDFDLARIDRALAAVERAGVLLQVGFNRRFDPSFRRVRELVAAGAVGQPHLVRITSRDPAPPPIAYIQVSGGIFLDMTIHDFDMARFLIGSEVREVFAVGEVLVDPAIGAAGDLDTVLVTLRFENGALGMIDNSRRAVYGYDLRVEVFGSGGGGGGGQSVSQQRRAQRRGVGAARPAVALLPRTLPGGLHRGDGGVHRLRADGGDAPGHRTRWAAAGGDGLRSPPLGRGAPSGGTGRDRITDGYG